MPQQLNLSVYRGDSYHWTFQLFTNAAQTIPYDLTGATAKAEVRSGSGAPVLATLACVITLPNTIVVTLTALASSALTFVAAQWDLQLTWAGGDVKTVVAGSISVSPDITDSTRAAALAAEAEAPPEPRISAWEQRKAAG